MLLSATAAAVGAVEAIRRNDKNGSIVIISSEKYHVYSRPLISYLLMGKVDEDGMKYRNDSFYSDNRCELLSGKTAKRIDPEKSW